MSPFWGCLTRNKESQVNQLEIPRRVFDDRFPLKRCGARYSSSSCHQEELAQLKKIIGPNLIILSTLRDVKNQETKQWRQSCPQISGLQGAPAPSIWNKEISGNSPWVVSLRAVLYLLWERINTSLLLWDPILSEGNGLRPEICQTTPFHL